MKIEIAMSPFTMVLVSHGCVETCYDDEAVRQRLEENGWRESVRSFRGDQYVITYAKEER